MPPTRRLSTRSRTSEASSYDNPAPTTANTQARPRRADRSGRAIRGSRALSSTSTSTSRSTGRPRSAGPSRPATIDSEIKQEQHESANGAGAGAAGPRGRQSANGAGVTKIKLRVGGGGSTPGPSVSTAGAVSGTSGARNKGDEADEDELSSELSEMESEEYGDLPAVLLPPRPDLSGTASRSTAGQGDPNGPSTSSWTNGTATKSRGSLSDSEGGSDYNPKSKGKSSARTTTKGKGKGKARADASGRDDLSDTDHDDDRIDVPLAAGKRKRSSMAAGKKRKTSTASVDIVDLSSSQVLDSSGAGPMDTSNGRGADTKAAEEVVPKKRKLPDPDDALAAYSCPICFGTLENPVMTLCGHLLCAKCLLDALIAAIKRNPDPTPGPRGNARGRGRGRGRGGRGGQIHSNFNPDHNNQRTITHPDAHPQGGPPEWTADMLKQAWYEHKVREINRALPEVPPPGDNALRMQELDAAGRGIVQEQVKGLWMLEEGVYVVEGECPVCRKALPGGFGPPNSGIGGVIPLHVRAK